MAKKTSMRKGELSLVEQFVGTSYDIVRTVYNNLSALVNLNDNTQSLLDAETNTVAAASQAATDAATAQQAAIDAGIHYASFNVSGTLAVQDYPEFWVSPAPGVTVIEMQVWLQTAPLSESLVVQLKVDDVLVGDAVTLLVGEDIKNVVFGTPVSFTDSQKLTLAITGGSKPNSGKDLSLRIKYTITN